MYDAYSEVIHAEVIDVYALWSLTNKLTTVWKPDRDHKPVTPEVRV